MQHETMLSILADEEKSQGKFIARADALQLARELDPEHYMGMMGLDSFNQLWGAWVKVRKYSG